MRPTFTALILLAASATPLLAESATTAMSAIKLLPKGEAKKLARIEAREGNLVPERWYLLVHNPAEESGLHEYVVAGGEVVASRSLSQFAEGLKAEDVIGGDAVKVDSDRAVKIAKEFAVANNVVPASFSYQLRKDDTDNIPVWNVTCVDGAGKAVGGVVVAANKFSVLSHSGFAIEPDKKQKAEPSADEERDREPLRQNKKRYVVRARGPEPMRQPPVAEKPNFFQRIFGR